jgi:hypothetical protein
VMTVRATPASKTRRAEDGAVMSGFRWHRTQ